MKVTMKDNSTQRMIFLIFTSLLISIVSSQPTAAPEVSNEGCKTDLVTSYSMKGTAMPIVETMEMCPTVVRSCCLKSDQTVMYTNFIHGGEYQRIIDHFTRVVGIYESLLNSLTRVQDFAKTVKTNNVKKVANCKLLAERVLNYDVAQVTEQIRQNLNKLKDFFQTSYSAFYCVICNFDYHKFFDPKSQVVFFSESFCRDIIQNTLHTLLLMHVDIVKHANLATKFTVSCDFTGAYNLDAVVPSNFTFSVTNDILQDLQSCRDNRNKREWFSYCKDICMNFKINSFSDYFQPNLELISAYVYFLDNLLGQNSAAQGARPLYGALSTPTGTTGGKRILQESKDKPIINCGLSCTQNLQTYAAEFVQSGVDMYKEGQAQQINEQTFAAVKVALQIMSTQNNKANTDVANPGNQATTTAKTPSRKLKTSMIAKFGMAVVMIMMALLK